MIARLILSPFLLSIYYLPGILVFVFCYRNRDVVQLWIFDVIFGGVIYPITNANLRMKLRINTGAYYREKYDPSTFTKVTPISCFIFSKWFDSYLQILRLVLFLWNYASCPPLSLISNLNDQWAETAILYDVARPTKTITRVNHS